MISIAHTVSPNDTLYQLAIYYCTTVEKILMANRYVNPYNLKVGDTLTIYPGVCYCNQQNSQDIHKNYDCDKKIALSNEMRLAWEQHVYWTRMLLISLADKLADEKYVEARLMKNPHDIAAIFGKYYGNDVAKTIEDLLAEHLKIGGELIVALRDGESEKADMLSKQWYMNADKMAEAFSSINPNYKLEDMRKMLYEHLRLTTQEVAMRLSGKYAEDIAAFDLVEKDAMEMADTFTEGIMKQFPQKFS